jgi:phosphoribosylformylglycinamidine synthase
VGDPFLEKLLLEACLEAMRSGAIAGIQDMGAAGLTSSSCEMAARAGTGIELDLTLVPQREENMTAYEMLLSESQERMLIVAHSGRERQVIDVFRKWDLDAVVIGYVRSGSNMRIMHNGELHADIPVAALTDEAPKYSRPMCAPATGAGSQGPGDGSAESSATGHEVGTGSGSDRVAVEDHTSSPNYHAASQHAQALSSKLQAPNSDYTQTLRDLLASTNLSSKEWVYRQYDHMVRTNTAVLPGADAAVIRIKETRRALAMCLDGNGRYCAVNPREGAKLIVAEAARNVTCIGARTIAVTNCLNFASPERPEVMWSFSEVIDGMAEACRAFETPVVSGNVSFYNETEGRGILPTPVIGMVGLVEDVRRIVTQGFKFEGDLIALLGETNDDLSVSEYAVIVEGTSIDEMIAHGRVPVIDLHRERAVQQVCLQAAEAGLLCSAHDCSDGGLGIALAELCFSSHNRAAIGAQIDLGGELPVATRLFSESPSRIVISFAEADRDRIAELAQAAGCPFRIIGTVGGERLTITADGATVVASPVAELESTWRHALGRKIQVEAMTVGAD